VKIGSEAIIGAGAVVTVDIPPYAAEITAKILISIPQWANRKLLEIPWWSILMTLYLDFIAQKDLKIELVKTTFISAPNDLPRFRAEVLNEW
jgi:hypothetical protein